MNQLGYRENPEDTLKTEHLAQHEEQRNSLRATAALHTGKNVTD